MLELRDGANCYSQAMVGVNVGLAFVEAVIAVLSLYQLVRIHLRNSHIGWTRQKVFHLIIGSSNLGYFLYFVLNLVAACKGWTCWSYSCGFFVMAFPKILFMSAFLLLLSFWVDLCHQSTDVDEDEECSSQEPLLDKTSRRESNSSALRRCCTFRCSCHVGSRQKFVILVILLIFGMLVATCVLIRIGMGKSHIDSAVVAQIYVDLIAVLFILLGGALAFYGLRLFLRMRRVRSERASSDTWKVAGLAVVSVISFTTSASIAMATNVPLFYRWNGRNIDSVSTSLLLVLYYFIGLSIPSTFLLVMMRELPPPAVTYRQEEARILAFRAGGSGEQPWIAARSTHSQVREQVQYEA